jgi:NADPH2:quinone reductase
VKAIVLRHPGGPTALSYEEVPMPEVKDGWTLLKVKGFGINRSEIFTRNGWSPTVKLPRILGIECVGEVVKTTDPDRLQKGEMVIATMGGMGRDFDGSYAEYALLPNKRIFTVQTNLAIPELAAVPETYGTAFGSLLKLKIEDAHSLLIRGATSGVGVAAAKLAKAMVPSIQLVGSTRHLEKTDELKSAGFNEVVLDKDNQINTNGEKYDRLLELVGPLTLPSSMMAVKEDGIACITGELGGVWDLTHWEPIYGLHGAYLTSFSSGALNQSMFDQLFELIKRSSIDVAPTKTFDLKHTADAQAYLDSHNSFGKVVVLP